MACRKAASVFIRLTLQKARQGLWLPRCRALPADGSSACRQLQTSAWGQAGGLRGYSQ
jgi:hypothetical protein